MNGDKNHDVLSLAECQSLLLQIENEPHARNMVRDYLLCLLMMDAGLRVGELVALHWRDVEINNSIAKAVRIRSDIAKNERERVVPMTIRTIDCLKSYKLERRPEPANTPWWLFPAPGGYPDHICIRTVQKLIGRISLPAIGRHIHPHTLRHTYATMMLQVADVRVVQELLGHSNIGTTQIYTHPGPDDLQQAVDKMTMGRVRY